MGNTCPSCGGAGICHQCAGEGTSYRGRCIWCSGTGKCPHCHPIYEELGISKSSRTTVNENSPQETTVSTKQTCSQCGQAFDGDVCGVCVSRTEDINQTFSICIPLALVGLLGSMFAPQLYHPLNMSDQLLVFILSFSGILVVAVWIAMLSGRWMRYAVLVRVLIALAAATLILPAPYFLLNGILDGHTPVKAQAVVSSKHVEKSGRWGPLVNKYVVVFNLMWHDENIENEFTVSREDFDAAEPGDSVRVLIHAGEFAQPWYSDAALASSLLSDSR
jgi:hypothetical protein